MLAILDSLNAHNLPIFHSIMMIPFSKFRVIELFSIKQMLSPLSKKNLFFSILVFMSI